VPLQPTLFLILDFNPRELYYRGYGNNINNTVIIIIVVVVVVKQELCRD